MRYFVKDKRPEWDSKLDILSLAVAGTLGGEYWTKGVTGGAVAQAADGKCEVPAGCNVSCLIVHDPLDYPVKSRVLFRIGLGEVPGCSANLSSYPLRRRDMYRLPLSRHFDAVVGGECAEGYEEALARAGLSGKRVAVAIAGSELSGKVAEILKLDNEVSLVDTPQLPVVSALYRTCGTVVHLGHCRRGYLHSLAMYHAGVEGRKLVERVPGEKFVPATVEQMIQILGR